MAKKESKTIKHQKIGVPAFKTKHEFDVFEVGVLMGADAAIDAAIDALKLTITEIADSVEKIKGDLPDDD